MHSSLNESPERWDFHSEKWSLWWDPSHEYPSFHHFLSAKKSFISRVISRSCWSWPSIYYPPGELARLLIHIQANTTNYQSVRRSLICVCVCVCVTDWPDSDWLCLYSCILPWKCSHFHICQSVCVYKCVSLSVSTRVSVCLCLQQCVCPAVCGCVCVWDWVCRLDWSTYITSTAAATTDMDTDRQSSL